MWPAALTRFLRRRLLWLTLLIVTLVYLLNYLRKNGFHNLHHSELIIERERPLVWRTLQEHLLTSDNVSNRTNDLTTKCRNSVQGRELLADDQGFVCPRTQLLRNGCCNVELVDTLYYVCDTCNSTSHCCEIYEYCVSCCLHPSKRPLLELVMNRTRGRQALVYAAVEDHFELCLVKCRTNSHSVEHENRYRNSDAKYCYGYTEAHESQREVSGSAGS